MRKGTNKMIIISMIFLSFGFGQEKVNWDVVNKIMDQGFNKSKVIDYAWEMTDGNGPRLTNSKGLERAQNWAMETLKGMGLKNVKLDEFGEFGKQWDTKKYGVELVAPYYERLIASPKAWTGSTNGVITGTPVLVEINSESDFDKYKGKLAGKIVMTKANFNYALRDVPEATRMTEEELMKMQDMMSSGGGSRYDLPSFLKPYQAQVFGIFREMRAMAAKASTFLAGEGVAAILTMSRGGQHGTVFTSNGASFRKDAPTALAEFEMLPEHYVRVVKLIEKGKNPVVSVEMMNEISNDKPMGYNVTGEIPGRGKLADEVVMIGAHFDSWHAATGATDNAAGSSSMMEVMRILTEVLKSDDAKNRRTIRIALWSGEEQGLFGSMGYVKKHVADKVKQKDGSYEFDLKDGHKEISAYYNIDNGTGKIRGVYLEGNAAVAPIFEEYLKPFHAYGAKTLTMSPTGGTDHMAFDMVGVPGFQFIQDPIEYTTRTHHTNMDNFYRLQEDDLKQIATIVSTFVYHTATRSEKLPRKVMPKARASRW